MKIVHTYFIQLVQKLEKRTSDTETFLLGHIC